MENDLPGSPSRGELLTIRLLQLVGLAWLGALLDPVGSLLHDRQPLLALAATLAGSAVFVGIYVYLWLSGAPAWRRSAASAVRWSALRRWLPILALTVLSVALGLSQGLAWFELFIYASVAAGLRLPARQAVFAIAGLMALAALLGVVAHGRSTPLTGGSLYDLARLLLLIGAPGLAVATAMHSLTTLRELRVARAELARLAVAEERLRFARDLHDLLGRSLSLIALKSELAGQLVAAAPDRAVAEIRDVEDTARTALKDVREAVAGYRQPTVESELAAAREILGAAGIAVTVNGADRRPPLPRASEAALAWALREGVTNVVRHSGARRCAIRLQTGGDVARLEITDDGRGEAPPTQTSGHGLAGLAERVAAVGGILHSEPGPDGGFRLRATVPVFPANAAPGGSGPEPALEVGGR